MLDFEIDGRMSGGRDNRLKRLLRRRRRRRRNIIG